MIGAASAASEAVRLVQDARQAAALDTLIAAEGTGMFDELIVVTNDPLWNCDLLFDCVVDVDDIGRPFHFGRRLAEVAQRYRLSSVLYMGAGSAPLLGQADLFKIARSILSHELFLVTNNLHSADWVAFSPAGILSAFTERVERDNSLAWVLHREAGLPAEAWPPIAANRLDIDTPADLLVLTCHPACGARLAAKLVEQALDTSRLQGALRVLAEEGRQLLVAGRVPASTWAALEKNTLCWVRLFAEERGMVASGRQAKAQVRSLLGAFMDQVGVGSFFETLEAWSDAVFWDNRVLLAHRGLWPSDADRYASDLGWTDQVGDPFLRELTAAAMSSSIPVIMGGHSLVAGGLLALAEIAGNWQENRES